MKTMLLRFCVLPILAVMVACPNRTPYGRAVEVGLTITDSIHTGADTVDRLRAAGDLTADEEKTALTYMAALNNLDTIYGECVMEAHQLNSTKQEYVACAKTFMDNANSGTLLTDVHIKNPTSRERVLLVGNTAVTLLEQFITSLESSPSQ